MKRSATLVASLLLLGAAPIITHAQTTWASFRGPQGAGEATDGLPPGDGPLSLDLVWKRKLGSGYSGISVADGTLVTAATDGERDYVIALDPDTGDERWRFDLAPIYAGHDGSHDGPISTPAIAEGRVFAVSPWGRVVALELATGTEIWSVHLVDDLGSEKPFYGFGSSPTLAGQTMILQIGGTQGSVAGFDVATGELRWRAVEDEISSESPILATVAERQQVLVLGVKKLAGIDPEDGTILWQIEHGAEENAMGAYTASPLPLGRDRILIKLDGGKTAIVQVSREGEQFTATIDKTSRGMTKSYSPPSRADQHVYGYTARFLSAVDSASGELLWRSRDPGDGFPVAVGDQLAVLTKTGELVLGPASPDGWSETTRLELFDDLAWTPPSYAAGAFYLRSLGEIARVDLVRQEITLVADTQRDLPPLLASLATEVGASENPDAVVTAFLAGKESPLVDGEEVVFVWHGEAQDVAIAGEMIGMRREEPMRRLEGTDLWWWSTTLDPRARISYLYYVDYQPTTDPTHDRITESTILGADMNWNRGEGVTMSWFAMPDWPGRAFDTATTESGTATVGRVETLEMNLRPSATDGEETSEPIAVALPIWLPSDYATSDRRYPVLYVNSPVARELGGWQQTLDRVVGESTAPVIAVFLEFQVPGWGEILTQQIIPEVDKRYRTHANAQNRALIGMAWPGLGAAINAFRHPDFFGVLAVQSFFALEEHMTMIREAIGEQTASSRPMRIYLEWGRWDLISPHEEMNFRASSRAFWDMLRDRGWEPLGGEVWDSTDWASWRNRTGVMLEALYPLAPQPTGLGPWLTSAQ